LIKKIFQLILDLKEEIFPMKNALKRLPKERLTCIKTVGFLTRESVFCEGVWGLLKMSYIITKALGCFIPSRMVSAV
jgi:hypothetical protein